MLTYTNRDIIEDVAKRLAAAEQLNEQQQSILNILKKVLASGTGQRVGIAFSPWERVEWSFLEIESQLLTINKH